MAVSIPFSFYPEWLSSGRINRFHGAYRTTYRRSPRFSGCIFLDIWSFRRIGTNMHNLHWFTFGEAFKSKHYQARDYPFSFLAALTAFSKSLRVIKSGCIIITVHCHLFLSDVSGHKNFHVFCPPESLQCHNRKIRSACLLLVKFDGISNGI